MKRRAPVEVRCNWQRIPWPNAPRDAKTGRRATGLYRCADCKAETANLPLYRYDVCRVKDRRKGKPDRRSR